jgi:hypothetical protein
VCTENRVRIDLMTEWPNVIGDDRAAILLTDVVHLAIQIEEPAEAGNAVLRLDRRNLVWVGVTTNPTAEWIVRQPNRGIPLG